MWKRGGGEVHFKTHPPSLDPPIYSNFTPYDHTRIYLHTNSSIYFNIMNQHFQLVCVSRKKKNATCWFINFDTHVHWLKKYVIVSLTGYM